MAVRKLKLTQEQHEWINGWMELFGAWAYSGRLEKRQSSVIAQYMATVEPQSYPERPMCNDDDGLLISQVVGSVMSIDTKALGILLSYYAHGSSKRAIASYYYKVASPRKMSGRSGEGFRKPSLATCRNEVDEILSASLYILYQPLQNAFNDRNIASKSKKPANKWLTNVSHLATI